MRRTVIALTTTLVFLVGCAVNPVTGERNFNFYKDTKWDNNIGAQMYAPMRQSQGGDFILDPELTRYVQGIGDRLVQHAHYKNEFDYEFHILNDSVPNAWALPGGKIVINRGLLTEMKSEAELAAVMGHEIIHADSRHGARQQSKGMLTQAGAVASLILVGTQVDSQQAMQVAGLGINLGAQLVTTKFGRDAERESDEYGMRYMSQAGYDPQGAVELQETFLKLSEGRNQDWLSGLFASHPPSRERVENNKATAATLPKGGEMGRERYAQKMAYLRRVKPAYDAYDEARKAAAEKNTQQARNKLREALRIEPREAQFYALSGDLDLADKNYNNAIREYNRALSRDDNFFYYYLRRGQAKHELKQYQNARVDLEKSLELLPTAQAHYLLGSLDKRAGNMQSAVKHFQAAAGSNSPEGKQAQTELVLLDLPQNPGKYIAIQAVTDRNGNVYFQLGNRTGVAVRNIRVDVAWLKDDGSVSRQQRTYRGPLAAGKQDAVSLGLRVTSSEELQRRVRVQVAAAQVAE